MVGVVMYFCENRSIIMGHHSPLPSPTCKGKSLRCLRKCRFPYIDTSPALSVRRHLTAALHLGCQTHQTWCAPRHFGAVPSLIGGKCGVGRLVTTRPARLGCASPGPSHRATSPRLEKSRVRLDLGRGARSRPGKALGLTVPRHCSLPPTR
jgi:hypothetical protein